MPARGARARRAVEAVVAAGYENLGTLEFLLDRDGNFFFIEINCRIQVEHPVTEMLSGLDLVAEQIRIAAGEPLGYRQADDHAPRPRHRVPHQRGGRGARLPAAGRRRRDATCAPGGPGVRMDSHLYSGYEVPPYYDSLLGKLVVWGPDRDEAIARSRDALDELVVDGIVTNVPLHRALLEHETFLERRIHDQPARPRRQRRLPARPQPPPDSSMRQRDDASTDAPTDQSRPTTRSDAAERVVLTTAQIQALIPHRWPFLLVDRIVEYDPARGYIRGEKAVTATEWFFQGHFPQLPVMPGVLQVEALAQTMAVYVAQQEGFGDRIGLFAGIDECRFKRVVQPGDRLSLEVTMDKLGGVEHHHGGGQRES